MIKTILAWSHRDVLGGKGLQQNQTSVTPMKQTLTGPHTPNARPGTSSAEAVARFDEPGGCSPQSLMHDENSTCESN